MKVLLVKTSSIGDVVHTLPAVTDAARAVPGLVLDWVVEEGLAPIPGWHPAVRRVIPVALRRWRRQPVASLLSGAVRRFAADLRQDRYDAVVDAQGLYKSAAIARLAKGTRHGLDRRSAREPLAALAYRQRYGIATGDHAVRRVRALMAAALGYALPETEADAGLDRAAFPSPDGSDPTVVFLHGTAWPTKRWAVARWQEAAADLAGRGFAVRLPWADDTDRERATAIAATVAGAEAVATPTLDAAAALLAHASGVIAVDTGLAHLAAAFGVPAVTLYGPTSVGLTGTIGPAQARITASLDCAPCRRRLCRIAADAAAPPPCLAAIDGSAVAARLTDLMRNHAPGSVDSCALPS